MPGTSVNQLPATLDGGSAVSAFDRLLGNNKVFSRSFERPGVPAAPATKVAVVACMDARLDVFAVLGLEPGDAHVIRNAGGAVTEDVIRSLLISQRELGTRHVALIHHSGCGMLGVRDEEVKDAVERETGHRPPFALEGFTSLEAHLRESAAKLRESPFLTRGGEVRGFVYDVDTGRLREVHLR